MSWEECGFSPGPTHGSPTCRKCSDCDGQHHFYVSTRDEDAGKQHAAQLAGHDAWFECKHCDAWAEALDMDEDYDLDDGPFVCPGCHCVGSAPHAPDCIDEEIRLERESGDDSQMDLFGDGDE